MTWASQCWDHARCLDLQDHGITVPVRLPSKEAIGKWLPAEVANCLCDGIDLPDSVMGESRLGNFEGFNMEREVCCLLQLMCMPAAIIQHWRQRHIIPEAGSNCHGTCHPHVSIARGCLDLCFTVCRRLQRMLI